MARARLVLLVSLGTLAYLGLAILGFGGASAFFSHPPLTGLAIGLAVLSFAAVFSSGNLSTGVREDRRNRWILFPMTVIGILSGYVPAYMDRHDLWTLDGETIRWFGLVIFLAGSTLRLSAVFVLGSRFSGLVAIQPGHALMTTGLYRVIRHPSYLGLVAGLLGWGLCFRSVVGVLLAASTVPLLLARIRAEEALLRDQFGTDYIAYQARTWRLIPGLY